MLKKKHRKQARPDYVSLATFFKKIIPLIWKLAALLHNCRLLVNIIVINDDHIGLYKVKHMFLVDSTPEFTTPLSAPPLLSDST